MKSVKVIYILSSILHKIEYLNIIFWYKVKYIKAYYLARFIRNKKITQKYNKELIIIKQYYIK